MKLEFRAITKSDLKRDSAVMMSSTIPSAKYSCSGSPDIFWNGSTAIEGLSGRASAALASRRTSCAFKAPWLAKLNPPRLHGLGDILEALRPKVFPGDLDLSPNLPIGVIGYANATRLCNALQPCGNVNAVAEDIVFIDDDVADMNTDPEFDSDSCAVTILLAMTRWTSTAAANGIDGAGEFDKHAVAGGLDDVPAMGGDGRIN